MALESLRQRFVFSTSSSVANVALYNSSVVNKQMSALPLALVCGDPSGVGPEVISGALEAGDGKGDVLIGPHSWAEPLAAKWNLNFKGVGPEDFDVIPGQPSETGARVALAALEEAVSGCLKGDYCGVVSGPVSKYWLQRVGFKHPGQTEFFAERWGGEPTMCFVGKRLRVVLATRHLPLSQVVAALTPEALELAVRRAYTLGRCFGVSEPRIGICGLNPHAGESGLLGKEEVEILDPTLDRLREEISGLSRCLPGDTVFHRQLEGDFDVVVAAYHDQGLCAVKTLEFDLAVNLTLGLPYVRTSPDHGTAFEIAGKGLADSVSFRAAFELARKLTAEKV